LLKLKSVTAEVTKGFVPPIAMNLRVKYYFFHSGLKEHYSPLLSKRRGGPDGQLSI
jgi:hypothetical protein